MKIAIFGLGYVGLTAAGCLSSQGHHVVGVDTNPEKIRQLRAGRCPITEPGVDVLLFDAMRVGRLEVTTELADRLADRDMAVVCVGTPSAADGSHDMSHIMDVTRQIADCVDWDRSDPLTVVYRSTIRPGTIDTLIAPVFRAHLGDRLAAVELVYNPEFLRESMAVRDFFAPPKIVIGTRDGRPSAKMAALNAGVNAPVFHTGYREAEFTKFADNSFHAVKVAFANELGRVCHELGVSARTVHEIFVSDTKLNISACYMRPGGAFGGSCLPKDVRALQHMSREARAGTSLINAVIESNEVHKRFLFDYCTRGLKPASRILLLGLAFKADSDDLRESPNVDLAHRLLDAGFRLEIFDASIKPDTLIGANQAYIAARLPQLGDLLVNEATARAGSYDRVIDASGRGHALGLGDVELVDIHTLP
jgi:GDP-mannose 6-dehydrogenase